MDGFSRDERMAYNRGLTDAADVVHQYVEQFRGIDKSAAHTMESLIRDKQLPEDGTPSGCGRCTVPDAVPPQQRKRDNALLFDLLLLLGEEHSKETIEQMTDGQFWEVMGWVRSACLAAADCPISPGDRPDWLVPGMVLPGGHYVPNPFK